MILPKVEIVPRIIRTPDYRSSDNYGALHIAAKYCNSPLPETFPYVWQHGVMGPWVTDALFAVYYPPEPQSKTYFVSRSDHVDALHDVGCNNAHAIGMPIVYTDDPLQDVKRIPRSLLIMPQHQLSFQQMGNEEVRTAYINQLEPYLSDFSSVTCCLCSVNFKRDFFKKDCDRLGIEVIAGADPDDRNALPRMRYIMAQAETMTTNAWGTHIAYALAYGVKVSIFGNPFHVPTNDLRKDYGWNNMTDDQIALKAKQETRDRDALLGPFNVPPNVALRGIETGRWLIGENNKRSPLELRQLFKWGQK